MMRTPVDFLIAPLSHLFSWIVLLTLKPLLRACLPVVLPGNRRRYLAIIDTLRIDTDFGFISMVAVLASAAVAVEVWLWLQADFGNYAILLGIATFLALLYTYFFLFILMESRRSD